MSDSIIDLHLPYKTQSVNNFIKEFFSEAKENSEQAVSIKGNYPERLSEFAKQGANEILRAFVGDVSATPGYLAACLMIGSAHGYEFQKAVIQLEEEIFVRQEWNDISKSTTIVNDVKIDIDFREELRQLRHENWKLQSTEHSENRNIDRKSGIEGRHATLYIASGLESEWIVCPNLLLNGEYSNNALNRILRVVGEMEEKVTLV